MNHPDKKITRFCYIISEINEINDKLEKAQALFYDGGTPFEKIYGGDISDLASLHAELRDLVKYITKLQDNGGG